MFGRRRSTVENSAPVTEPAAVKVPSRHLRVGLWVLSAFATVAALVAISAMLIGRDNADINILIPLVLFWSITVCVGFAIRSALMNVVRTMKRTRPQMPDAALDRLARMAQREQRHASAHPHLARALSHAS